MTRIFLLILFMLTMESVYAETYDTASLDLVSTQKKFTSFGSENIVKGFFDRISEQNGKVYLHGWACTVGESSSMELSVYAIYPGDLEPKGTVVARGFTTLSSENGVSLACQVPQGQKLRYSIEIPAEQLSQFLGKRVYVHAKKIGESGVGKRLVKSKDFRLPYEAPVAKKSCGSTPHGESEAIVCYAKSVVPAGQVCESFVSSRMCTDGQFSNSSPACPARTCQVAANRVPPGDGSRIIANYHDDFRVDRFPEAWKYLWNAPTDGKNGGGYIGNPKTYKELKSTGSMWTADGDENFQNSNSSRYLRLDSSGGHPGSPAGYRDNNVDRYAIAAYTLSEDGYYSITGSRFQKNKKWDPVEVLLHINDQSPIRSKLSPEQSGVGTFDINLGKLNSGDTIYVSFGPYITDHADKFSANFEIVKHAVRNDLQAIFDREIAKEDQVVSIPSGDYRVTPNSDGIHFEINDVHGRYIKMNGVNLLATETTRALKIRRIKNSTLEGLSIDYSPLTFAQFEIIGISQDHKSIDLRLLDGYDVINFSGDTTGQLNARGALNNLKVFDPKTKVMKKIYGSLVQGIEKIGERKYRFTKVKNYYYKPKDINEKIGDHVVINTKFNNPNSGYEPHAVQIGGAENFVLKDVNVYTSDFVAIWEGYGLNTTYKNVNISPALGKDDFRVREGRRLQSASRAGYHILQERSGSSTTLDGCVTEYMDDDGIMIKGNMNMVQGVDGNKVSIVDKAGRNAIVAGKTVEFVSFQGEYLGEAKVLSMSSKLGLITDSMLSFWNKYMKKYLGQLSASWELVLDRKLEGVDMGSMVYLKDGKGSNITIKNSKFGHTRSRAIVLRGDNLKIDNVDIEHTWLPGIMIAGELISLEGGFPRDVSITKSRIMSSRSEAIWVGLETIDGIIPPGQREMINQSIPKVGLYENIWINDNKLEGKEHDVQLMGVKGYTLRNNTYKNGINSVILINSERD